MCYRLEVKYGKSVQRPTNSREQEHLPMKKSYTAEDDGQTCLQK